MTMTDPISDMLTRIRNANIAMHDDVRMPRSKVKEALAEILHKEGYIEGYDVDDNPERPGRVLSIKMKYSPERPRMISGLRRVSKPGLRVYSQSDQGPAGPRRPGRRRPLDQPGAHDRPRGAQAQRGRRDPLLRLVAGDDRCRESASTPSRSPAAST